MCLNCKPEIIEQDFTLTGKETYFWAFIFEGYEDIATFTTLKKISKNEIIVRITYPHYYKKDINRITSDLLQRGEYDK